MNNSSLLTMHPTTTRGSQRCHPEIGFQSKALIEWRTSQRWDCSYRSLSLSLSISLSPPPSLHLLFQCSSRHHWDQSRRKAGVHNERTHFLLLHVAPVTCADACSKIPQMNVWSHFASLDYHPRLWSCPLKWETGCRARTPEASCQ